MINSITELSRSNKKSRGTQMHGISHFSHWEYLEYVAYQRNHNKNRVLHLAQLLDCSHLLHTSTDTEHVHYSCILHVYHSSITAFEITRIFPLTSWYILFPQNLFIITMTTMTNYKYCCYLGRGEERGWNLYPYSIIKATFLFLINTDINIPTLRLLFFHTFVCLCF